MMRILWLIFWIALSFSAGWYGSQFKPGSWYTNLIKPPWTPPPLAFPIAWSILYTVMGISVWLVWEKRGLNPLTGIAIKIFIFQLILNALWSWLFFGLHEMGWAFVEIVALWISILVATLCFWQVSHAAAYLMLPYLIWVSIASALNWYLWKHN